MRADEGLVGFREGDDEGVQADLLADGVEEGREGWGGRVWEAGEKVGAEGAGEEGGFLGDEGEVRAVGEERGVVYGGVVVGYGAGVGCVEPGLLAGVW